MIHPQIATWLWDAAKKLHTCAHPFTHSFTEHFLCARSRAAGYRGPQVAGTGSYIGEAHSLGEKQTYTGRWEREGMRRSVWEWPLPCPLQSSPLHFLRGLSSRLQDIRKTRGRTNELGGRNLVSLLRRISVMSQVAIRSQFI